MKELMTEQVAELEGQVAEARARAIEPRESAEEDDEADEGTDSAGSSRERLWIGHVMYRDGRKDIIESKSIKEFRNLLQSPTIQEIMTIYRGFRKEFRQEVIRKVEIS